MSIIIFVLVFFAKISFGQIDSLNQSLDFKLIVYVLDEKSMEPFIGDIVNIEWDERDTTLITDSSGRVELILLPKKNYSIIVNSKDGKFMNFYDGISTKGLNKSKHFIKEFLTFKTEPLIKFPLISYKKDSYLPIFEEDSITALNYVYELMELNPEIVIKLIVYRSKKENKLISKERGLYFKNELIKMGINENRIVIIESSVFTEEVYGNYPDKSGYYGLLQYKILSWDFKE